MIGRLLLAALLLAAACHEAETPRPARLAAYAVGVTTREFVDTTRITPASGSAPQLSERHLVTEIWYPATGTPSADDTREAPLDAHTAPYPLVVFVHGSSGFRTASSFLAHALAAKGYVVASADMPLTALTFLGQGGPTDQHVDLQVGDVSFLADQLALTAKDDSDPLHGAVDPSQGFAVAGHSTGGTVALATAFAPDHHDARVKAAVALAPCACFFDPKLFTTRATPLLVMAGSNDKYVPPANNGHYAFSHAGQPKLFATLVGGSHLGFSDFGLQDQDGQAPTTSHDDLALSFLKYGGGEACEPVPPLGHDPAMNADDQHRLTSALTAAFLDAHLYGDAKSLAQIEAAPDASMKLETQ